MGAEMRGAFKWSRTRRQRGLGHHTLKPTHTHAHTCTNHTNTQRTPTHTRHTQDKIFKGVQEENTCEHTRKPSGSKRSADTTNSTTAQTLALIDTETPHKKHRNHNQRYWSQASRDRGAPEVPQMYTKTSNATATQGPQYTPFPARQHLHTNTHKRYKAHEHKHTHTHTHTLCTTN